MDVKKGRNIKQEQHGYVSLGFGKGTLNKGQKKGKKVEYEEEGEGEWGRRNKDKNKRNGRTQLEIKVIKGIYKYIYIYKGVKIEFPLIFSFLMQADMFIPSQIHIVDSRKLWLL